MEGVARAALPLALWLLLALQAARAARASAADYCSLCDEPGSHTMCVYPEPGPAPNCTNYRPAPLTAREKRAIVRTHNLVRRRVATGRAWARSSGFGPQPPAADMRQLHWDDELAMVAQRWADRCLSFYTHGPHDACRDLRRFPVGQNIVSTAYSKPAASDVRERTLDWYGELAFFDPAVVRRFAPNPDPDPSKQIGHYTQMVWGWTYAIGCARVVFEEQFPEEAGPWVVERLVCNYAPSGNYLGVPVYTVGAPCSRCPHGTVCSERYPGLCAFPAPAVAAAVAASNGSVGAGERPGDALQSLLPAPEAATEFASDEDAVLDGVRALENGTRPSETYKAPFEVEEPKDAQGAESRDAGAHPKAGADGGVSDGSDSNQSGEEGVDGDGSEDDGEEDYDGSEEDGDSSEDGKGKKGNGSSSDGAGSETGETSVDGKTSENGKTNESGEVSDGRKSGDASKSAWLFPTDVQPPSDKGRPAGHYFYYTYNFGADSSSL